MPTKKKFPGGSQCVWNNWTGVYLETIIKLTVGEDVIRKETIPEKHRMRGGKVSVPGENALISALGSLRRKRQKNGQETEGLGQWHHGSRINFKEPMMIIEVIGCITNSPLCNISAQEADFFMGVWSVFECLGVVCVS